MAMLSDGVGCVKAGMQMLGQKDGKIAWDRTQALRNQLRSLVPQPQCE